MREILIQQYHKGEDGCKIYLVVKLFR